tara:strand:- start:94 stop:330 length:237 start_codon:yes stop_codon:yes gene_type:complete
VNVGELVTLRLGDFGGNRHELLPGIVFAIGHNGTRKTYYVHAAGATYCVTDRDLGPVDIAFEIIEEHKKRRNEKEKNV